MRVSTGAVLAALISLAVAQDILGSLPKCGQNCFGNNFQGCAQFDYKCICGNKDLIAELSCCVSKNCSGDDQNTIITLASGLCKAYGVDVPTQASCAASASSTAAATTASTESSGSSGSSGASGSSTSVSSAGGSSITTAPGTTATGESQSAAGQSSTGSSGAAGPVATAGAGLGLALAGLLAAL